MESSCKQDLKVSIKIGQVIELSLVTNVDQGSIIPLGIASSTGYRGQRMRCVAHPYILQP